MKASFDPLIRALPAQHIEPAQVLKLVGVQPKELNRLLEQWERFTDDGLKTLEAITGAAAPNRTPMRFKQDPNYIETDIEQLSALTFISPKFGFVGVGDEKSELYNIKLNDGEAKVTTIRQDDDSFPGMEGSCFRRTDDGTFLRVLSEDKQTVWEVPFGGGSVGEIVRDWEIEGKKKKKSNKGYEGLDILPAHHSPDGNEYQLAVKEGKPRRVAILDPETLAVKGLADLPESLKKVMPDLSDIAVSPRGTIFILSDEGECFTEFALRKIEKGVGPGLSLPRWTLVPLATTYIDTDDIKIGKKFDRLQPEGLSFDQNGDLWVACEAKGILIRFAQQKD
jgi:uncharacterized protein YjiK